MELETVAHIVVVGLLMVVIGWTVWATILSPASEKEIDESRVVYRILEFTGSARPKVVIEQRAGYYHWVVVRTESTVEDAEKWVKVAATDCQRDQRGTLVGWYDNAGEKVEPE